MGNNNELETIRQSKHLFYGSTSWARRHSQILGPHVGSFRTTSLVALLVALSRCCWAKLPFAVSDYIDRYVPRGVDAKTWERIGAFVRDSVALAAPQTPYSAEVLIGRASHYVAWCVKKGWPLDAETIWSIQGIELFVSDGKGALNGRTRQNYHGWLLRIAQVLLPEENGEPLKPIVSPPSMAAPYSAKEMAEFRRWASLQRDPLKQYRAMLMLVLCAGAGLRGVDISGLKPGHVEPLEDGGYVIHVPGQDSRDVPLLAEWDDWMEVLLARVPDGHETLWGTPNVSRRHNLLSGFTKSTDGTPPTGPRLRETWTVAVPKGIAHLKSIFRAAGQSKFEKLSQFLFYVDDVSPDEYVRFLRQEDQS